MTRPLTLFLIAACALLAQPALTISWGVLLLGETLAPLQTAGAALVLGGIGVLSLRGAAGSPQPLD